MRYKFPLYLSMIIAIYGAAAEGVIKFDVYNIHWLFKFIYLLVSAPSRILFLIKRKTFIAFGMFDYISHVRNTFKLLGYGQKIIRE